MKCAICGADNLEGAAYCEDCGSKLPTSTVPETTAESEPEPIVEMESMSEPVSVGEGPVICPACNSENPAGARFCDDCGASLEGAVKGTVASPSMPEGTMKLIVEGSGQEFILDRDVITIGRQSPADGIFPEVDLTEIDTEAYISRRHARILKKDDGYIFEDTGSSNGSFINNVRINQGTQQAISEGDLIRLGKTVMKVTAI